MTPETLQQDITMRQYRKCIFKTLIIALWLLSFGIVAKDMNAVGAEKSERVILFSGYEWVVKSSRNSVSGMLGPGNNYFSDSIENIWLDKNGWLHLRITNKNGRWYCAEVSLTKPLGYKKYIFQVNGRIDHFHPCVVGGLFNYLDGTDNAAEMDIEFSQWGTKTKLNNAQYVLQPSENRGNVNSFKLVLTGDNTTHFFDWKPGKVDFASYNGHFISIPDSTLIINRWSYSGKDVPADQNGKIHINLWLFNRDKIDSADHPEAEMVITNFQAL